jgi:superfamily II DNA or RNA helicase
VIIDEGHLNAGPGMQALAQRLLDAGACILGMTATPIDIGHFYDHLIVCGTNSELRACGALVPAIHYAPDEPDMKLLAQLKVKMGEELSERQQREAMMPNEKVRAVLWGRVLEWFNRINPTRRPTILFAPGVKESIWFAEQFSNAGITAAHIDGETVWQAGVAERSSRATRDAVLAGSRDGLITVLCNRFVLREGINATWLSHGIFATIFGSLQSYVQSGGRLLRAHPGLEEITIQDHGGNWHRHGSLNADREWALNYTATVVSGLREERLRAKKEKEPFVCPQCKRVWVAKTVCQCGYELPATYHTRSVVQVDGTLKEMRGDIFRRRRISQKPDGPKLWERMYYRAKSKKWDATFRQAEAVYAQENGWSWPSRMWPLMPIDPSDFFRKVADVPRERLRT